MTREVGLQGPSMRMFRITCSDNTSRQLVCVRAHIRQICRCMRLAARTTADRRCLCRGVNNLRYADIADLVQVEDLLVFDPHRMWSRRNPLQKMISTPTAVGEVWASILYDVYAGLVDTFGFSVNARTNPNDRGNRGDPTDFPAGNIVFMRLFMVTLPLLGFQPTCAWCASLASYSWPFLSCHRSYYLDTSWYHPLWRCSRACFAARFCEAWSWSRSCQPSK